MPKYTIEGQELDIRRIQVNVKESYARILFKNNFFTTLEGVPIKVEDETPVFMTERELWEIKRIYETQIEANCPTITLNRPMFRNLLKIANYHVRGEEDI